MGKFMSNHIHLADLHIIGGHCLLIYCISLHIGSDPTCILYFTSFYSAYLVGVLQLYMVSCDLPFYQVWYCCVFNQLFNIKWFSEQCTMDILISFRTFLWSVMRLIVYMYEINHQSQTVAQVQVTTYWSHCDITEMHVRFISPLSISFVINSTEITSDLRLQVNIFIILLDFLTNRLWRDHSSDQKSVGHAYDWFVIVILYL